MSAKLTNYERETIINFNEGEDTASIYTHKKSLRRRLEQLAQERPEKCRLHKVSHWGEAVEYYVPKSWVKITPTRILTNAQREALEKAHKAAKTSARADIQDSLTNTEGNYTPEDEKEA